MDLPRYCVVGLRPVKLVRTDDGGMDCLAYDPDRDDFVRDMTFLTRCVMPHDPETDVVDEAAFEEAVARMRARHQAP